MKDVNMFGYWKVIVAGGTNTICLCTGCNSTIKAIPNGNLRSGKSRSCGCQKTQLYKQTSLILYGTEYPTQSKIIRENTKKTNLQRYGAESPAENSVIREKMSSTLFRNHGVEHALQSPALLQKSRDTLQKNYGVDFPLQSTQIAERCKKTNLITYGVEYPAQNAEIALKGAKKQDSIYIKQHWKTNEDLICKGSYEAKTVEYLNSRKINYTWQPKAFKLSSGKTYRPDLHLTDQDLWIEIKGYFREKAKVKWNEFHTVIHLNSELWDKEKLQKMGVL